MADWKLKCPSCGELMDDPTPYKTVPVTAQYEEMSSWEFEPDWLVVLPIAGHKYRCECGCTVDIPSGKPQDRFSDDLSSQGSTYGGGQLNDVRKTHSAETVDNGFEGDA